MSNNLRLDFHRVVKMSQTTTPSRSIAGGYWTAFIFVDEDDTAIEITVYHDEKELLVVPEDEI